MTLMKKGEEALKTYLSLDTRIKIFMEGNRPSTTSSSKGIDFLEATVHLPEMRLPAFDRNIAHWSAFYNTFTLDNEQIPLSHSNSKIPLSASRPNSRSSGLREFIKLQRGKLP
jgi:hypothetical protein